MAAKVVKAPPADGPVYFWKPEQEHGYLSPWYPTQFKSTEPNGSTFSYCNTEQYLIHRKGLLFAPNSSVTHEILKTNSPAELRSLSHKIPNFDEVAWAKQQISVVTMGNYLKFTQDPGLKGLLLGTGSRELIEANPYDRVWGIGYDTKEAAAHRNRWGDNLMGKALMSVRKAIKSGGHPEVIRPTVTFDSAIYFNNPEQDYGFLSRWYVSKFTSSRFTYRTIQQYMAHRKGLLFAPNSSYTAAILDTTNPSALLKLSGQIPNFNEGIWQRERIRLLMTANWLRFTQDSSMKAKLLGTKNRELVESDPNDRYLGVGYDAATASQNRAKWGSNFHGKVLMQVRKLIVDSEASLVTIADKIKETRELNNRRRPINLLPPEVLSYIFILCEYADRPTWHMRNVATRGKPNLHYQTTLPAVCCYWRKVALDTPALWSRVTLSDPPPFHLSALYLSRSGTEAPLDIEVKITDKHLGYSDSWDPEAHRALPFIVTNGGITSRWRSCWIHTNDLPSHLAALSFILSSSLPILQYLEFDYCGPEYTSRRFEYGVYSNFISTGSLFYDPPTPQLQTAMLRSVPNICLFRHIDLLQPTKLAYLELDFCSPLPKLAQLNGLFAGCPRLVTLFLDSMLESHFGTEPDRPDEPVELPRVHLPLLRSLALKHTIRSSVSWELGLLKMINAPKVQSFQLYLTSNRDFDSGLIIDYITQGDNKINTGPIFPLLTSLGFFVQWDITPDLRRLLSTYTKVTTLVLPEFPELAALLDTPWLAPELKLLSLETKEYDVLRDLVALRRSAHLPLKIVELKKQTSVWEISPEEREGLEELVHLVFVDELEDRMSSMLILDTI